MRLRKYFSHMQLRFIIKRDSMGSTGGCFHVKSAVISIIEKLMGYRITETCLPMSQVKYITE